MFILDKILELLKNDTIQKILMVGVIGLLILILIRQCEDKNAIMQQNEQNQRALLDSLHQVKNKVGELSYEKTAFVANLEDMKKLNLEIYNEAIKIQGKVKTLQNVNITALIDSIRSAITTGSKTTPTKNGNLYSFDWNDGGYENGSLRTYTEGSSSVLHDTIPNDTVYGGKTKITKQTFALDLETYITEDSKGFMVGGVKPRQDTKGLSLSVNTGVFDISLSNKYKSITRPKFSFIFGPYAGIGYGGGYSSIPTVDGTNTYKGIGWSVGVGFSLGYSIFSF